MGSGMTDTLGETAAGAPIGRRVPPATLGLGAAGLAVAPSPRNGWEHVLGAASRVDPTGLSGPLPDPGGFRYHSVATGVPRKDATTHRLTVDGLADRPATHTLGDPRAMPRTRVVRDVARADGWGVADTPWQGVAPSTLLDAAGARPEGTAIRLTRLDGAHGESLTLGRARRPDVLVALRTRNQPVTHERGGPARPYVAPTHFHRSARRLSGITVTDRVIPGHWEDHGYDVDGRLPGADRGDRVPRA
jgi:DMSO/TMAO reductase YedYZ molybdopterin-dependent catalytic subunit